ncbi:dipeptide ABC transporter ATP-binding protein [Roseateles sp.]|uniref:dipeptide ABC transporter ATP-binding protein n=1 Tax=Roseateles sp. TaxID=1971397 RepID=UPI0039E9F6B3
MTALLQLRDLGVTLGGQIRLHGLNLEIGTGEVLGLVGESGSGKSLTALAVAGLLPAGAHAQGQVLLDGEDLLTLPEARMDERRGAVLGLVFQEPMNALNPLMTLSEQVAEAFSLHSGQRGPLSRREALAQAEAALARVGLEGLGRRHPHELSGGQRQRGVIAIAMALRPRLLIADEPTTALDVRTQAQVLTLLREMVREQGGSLLLISHDLPLVAGIADRIAVMRQGRLVEQGPARPLLRAPQRPETAELIAASALAERPAVQAPPLDAPLLAAEGLVREVRHRDGLFSRPVVKRLLDGVSLRIAPGERVGLVGESGCGKSTLLRALLALEPLQGGEVRLQGQRFTGAERELRRQVQIVFQDPAGSLDPRWRAWELVAEPLALLDSPPDRSAQRQRACEWLERVGLGADAAERHPHQFSGGQRQRLAIARALVLEPALLVLDEAVSALDVSVRGQILALIDALCRERGTALLFVTHDLGVVRAATDRLYVMQAGRIVESGATPDVFERPAQAYTQELLAATPDLAQALKRA